MTGSFRLRRLGTLLAAVCSALAACDSPAESGEAAAPAVVQVVSGEEQTGTVNTELPDPLVVKVLDTRGLPVPQQLVEFVVISGDGSVSTPSVVTDGAGEARSRWTLGVKAGADHRVEARVAGTGSNGSVVVTFRAVANPGDPTALAAVGQTVLVGGAGAPLDSLAVRVTDAHGNGVPGASVTWATTAGSGTVSPASSTTSADGVARTSWTLGLEVGAAETVRATAPVGTVAFTASTTMGQARVEVLVPSGTTATVGTNVEAVARIELLDGRGLSGVRVLWTIGSRAIGYSTTDSAGESRHLVELPTTAGGTALAAWLPGGLVRSLVLTLTPSTPTRIGPALVGAMVAGEQLTEPLEMTVRDRYGNRVPGASVAWNVAAGGGTVPSATSLADDRGIARTMWTLPPVAMRHRLFAVLERDSALISIDMAAAEPSTAEVTPSGATMEVEATTRFDVRFRDAYGNTASPASTDVSWSSSDPRWRRWSTPAPSANAGSSKASARERHPSGPPTPPPARPRP